MKKNIVYLSIFVFSLGLFFASASMASATTFANEEGCSPAGPFNVYTGKLCADASIRTDCLSGHLFSSVTGKPCGDRTIPPVDIDVCIYEYEDLRVGSRGDDVRSLQQMLKDKGFLLGRVDGIYGPITDGANVTYRKRCPFPTPNSPVISGVSGPQTLAVGQQGTWIIKASSPNGGNLSYSVNWGDRTQEFGGTADSPALSPTQQSATFTHTYHSAGTYTPTFTVTSSNTIFCITTPCPGNGGSAKASLSVRVGEVATNPTVTVLTPNGGETWTKGTTQTIKWQDHANISTHEVKLIRYYPPCTGEICSMSTAGLMSYIIANTQGSSYNWIVGSTVNNTTVPDGSYTVQVCQTGTSVCDSSNSHFQIVSSTPTQPLVINASRHGSSPSGNITVGTVDAELFRINLKASGQDATVTQLSFDLNGTAMSHVSNIRVFDETAKIQFGTLSDLANVHSWFYTGVVNVSLNIPAGTTKTLSVRGNVSPDAFANYASPCPSCSYWMYMNLTKVSLNTPTGVIGTILGLPVAGHTVYVPYGSPTLGLNRELRFF